MRRLPLNRKALDEALLDAHARDDRAALIGLYADAGDLAEAEGDMQAAGFYLTHAYVFALEAGDVRAEALHARLKVSGREE